MSDQVPEQSPQSRLEAMLGDSIESDVITPEVQEEEKEQPPLEAEAEATEEVESEEATEEPDEEVEEEEQSQDEVPAILKLKVNGEDVEKPLDEVVALAQQVAYEVMVNDEYKDVVPKSALFFHNVHVDPMWPYRQVKKIGNHIFYSKQKKQKTKLEDA